MVDQDRKNRGISWRRNIRLYLSGDKEVQCSEYLPGLDTRTGLDRLVLNIPPQLELNEYISLQLYTPFRPPIQHPIKRALKLNQKPCNACIRRGHKLREKSTRNTRITIDPLWYIIVSINQNEPARMAHTQPDPTSLPISIIQ